MYKNTWVKTKLEKLMDKFDVASGVVQSNPASIGYVAEHENQFEGL